MNPIDWDVLPMRALLFVPGSDEVKLGKVSRFGADAIVIDLEDAVAAEEKDAARGKTRAAIPELARGGVVTVRVNAIETGRLEDDVAAVTCSGLSALIVPKVEDAQTLAIVDGLLEAKERAQGLAVGSVRLLPIIETASGIVRCEDILGQAPPRTVTSIFGLGDFSTDLGVDVTADGAEFAYARGRIVVATRSAGLAPPIDGPYLDLTDEEGLVRTCRYVRGLGFQGKICVYPPQVVPMQRAFSELTADELVAARRLVEEFEAAETRGVASIRVDGRFVDYPIYRLARRKLDRWRSLQREDDADGG